MGEKPMDCPVCLTAFEDGVKRPRSLPCGHTVCAVCIFELEDQGCVTCPECRVTHAVPKGGQFPICYALEALIRSLRDAKVAEVPPLLQDTWEGNEAARAANQRKPADLSRKMRSILQAQETKVVAAIAACQEIHSQLDQYQTALTSWGKQQRQLEDRLQGLVDQSRSARELMGDEKSRAMAKKEEVKEGVQLLHAALETLRTLTTEQELSVAVTEAGRCTGKAQQVVEECQGRFPDADTINTARKVREGSNAALEAVQTVLQTHSTVTGEELRTQSDPELRSHSGIHSTIMDRLEVIIETRLKAEDLWSLRQPVRRLVESGLVFAVHLVEDHYRNARISLESGRLYIHALKEQCLPAGARTLQISKVVPSSLHCHLFLDLSWPGSVSRRVQVRVSYDTPAGKQFLLLCTGQRGASYANTSLFKVLNKGRPGESVCGGDYERNNGEGGAALLPDLGKGEYRESGRAGAVWGRWWWCGPDKGAHFGITTRDWQGGGQWVAVFGEVVDGLDVVVEAARYKHITDVTVVDCGVVL